MYYRRYRRRTTTGERVAIAAIAVVVLSGAHAVAKGAAKKNLPAAASGKAAEAIAYARAQLGKPYCWGGTGASCPNPPYTGYDCSGLVMEAYAAAGISIPRTSQAQWAALPHVAAGDVRPGDLVFFPGSDGTWTAPGHVALVIGGGQMIQAYATGVPIEVSPLNGDGAGGIVGYAQPWSN